MTWTKSRWWSHEESRKTPARPYPALLTSASTWMPACGDVVEDACGRCRVGEVGGNHVDGAPWVVRSSSARACSRSARRAVSTRSNPCGGEHAGEGGADAGRRAGDEGGACRGAAAPSDSVHHGNRKSYSEVRQSPESRVGDRTGFAQLGDLLKQPAWFPHRRASRVAPPGYTGRMPDRQKPHHRSPIRSAGTSPSSPTSTTARPRWSTPCSSRAARSAPTSAWPNARWTTPTSSASAASRSWPRTRRSTTTTSW